MNIFEQALEESYQLIEDMQEDTIEWFLEAYETDEGIDEEAFMEDFGHLPKEEYDDILEAMVKHVSSTGAVRKRQSRAIRSRRAVASTGMSKTALKIRARKAARTRKRNPGGVKIAKRKRAKAIRRRKAMGI